MAQKLKVTILSLPGLRQTITITMMMMMMTVAAMVELVMVELAWAVLVLVLWFLFKQPNEVFLSLMFNLLILLI